MESFRIKGGQRVKLGRLKPKEKPRAVKLSRFFNPAWQKLELPLELDRTRAAAGSIGKMYVNDQVGNCVIASKLHHLGVWSANDDDAPGEIVATDREALNEYRDICGPGDNGCYITRVLDVMKSRGLIAGGQVRKLDGYASVDTSNRELVRAALYVFGGITLGLDMPADWMNVPNLGKWDVSNSRRVGGHDVAAVGYHPGGVVVSTWGGLRTITWEALADRSIVDEAYVLLAPAWYNADGIAGSGFDVAGLRKALADLENGEVPDIDDPDPVPVDPVDPVAPWTWPAAVVDLAVELPAGLGGGLAKIRGPIRLEGPVPPQCACAMAGAMGFNWSAFVGLLIELAPIILAWIQANRSKDELLAIVKTLTGADGAKGTARK